MAASFEQLYFPSRSRGRRTREHSQQQELAAGRLCLDSTFELRDEVIKSSPSTETLHFLEQTLWRFIHFKASNCKESEDFQTIKMVFGIGSELVRILQELPVEATEGVIDSFVMTLAPSDSYQMECIKALQRPVEPFSNRSRTLEMVTIWCGYCEIIKSDPVGDIAGLQTGLLPELCELIKSRMAMDTINSLAALHPAFTLRCSEKVAGNLLVETNVSRIRNLQSQRFLQIVGSLRKFKENMVMMDIDNDAPASSGLA